MRCLGEENSDCGLKDIKGGEKMKKISTTPFLPLLLGLLLLFQGSGDNTAEL